MEVPVNWIEANPKNPRRNFDQAALQELAESIKSVGIVQPLVVVMDEGRTKETKENDRFYFRLVAGERRWWAAQLAGLEKVPVVVKKFTPEQEVEVMIIENLQRQSLDPLDEARGMQSMVHEYKWTQEQLAEKIGCSQGHISNRLRLLDLPYEVQQNISQEIITPAHAKHLLKLKVFPELLNRVVKDVIEYNCSEKRTNELVDEMIRTKFPRLFKTDEYWFNHQYHFKENPYFDVDNCKGCEHVIKAQALGDLNRFCTDPQCWEEKQIPAREVEKKRVAAEEAKLAAKLVKKGVVRLSLIRVDQYQIFNDPDFRDDADCKDCDQVKTGQYASGATIPVCLNMKCVRGKKLKAGKARMAAKCQKIKSEIAKASDIAKSIVTNDFSKESLIYIAGLIISSIEPSYDRELKRNDLLRDVLGWDKEAVKAIGSAYSNGMRDNYWIQIVSQLEKLPENELVELIFKWPLITHGFDTSFNEWILSKSKVDEVMAEHDNSSGGSPSA